MVKPSGKKRRNISFHIPTGCDSLQAFRLSTRKPIYPWAANFHVSWICFIATAFTWLKWTITLLLEPRSITERISHCCIFAKRQYSISGVSLTSFARKFDVAIVDEAIKFRSKKVSATVGHPSACSEESECHYPFNLFWFRETFAQLPLSYSHCKYRTIPRFMMSLSYAIDSKPWLSWAPHLDAAPHVHHQPIELSLLFSDLSSSMVPEGHRMLCKQDGCTSSPLPTVLNGHQHPVDFPSGWNNHSQAECRIVFRRVNHKDIWISHLAKSICWRSGSVVSAARLVADIYGNMLTDLCEITRTVILGTTPYRSQIALIKRNCHVDTIPLRTQFGRYQNAFKERVS